MGVFVVLSIGSTTKGAAISDSDLPMIAMILSGSWLTAMITLLISSEKGFRNTFYQPMRAWEYNKALFDTGIDEYAGRASEASEAVRTPAGATTRHIRLACFAIDWLR